MDSATPISGSELVEGARSLVLLGHSREAYDLMVKIVKSKEAYSILRGYKTLEGDNLKGYQVVDDESEVYFENLQNSYAGKCWMKGKFFEPYALTPEVAEEDIPLWIMDRALLQGQSLSQIFKSYALSLYADNPMEDIAVHIKNPEKYQAYGGDGETGWVLFRMTTPAPFWAARITKPKEAITEFVEAFGVIPQVAANVIPFNPKPKAPVTPAWNSYSSYTPPKKFTEEEIQGFRDKILAQTTGFYEVEADGVTYKIPKEPFQQWVLKARPDKALPWTPITPKGTSYNSCQYRSDWMIAAGIPLEDYWKTTSGPMKAAKELAGKLSTEYLETSAAIFGYSSYGTSGKVYEGDKATGKEYGLFVVEEASADYLQLALHGSAIIAEKPGKLLKMALVENSGITIAIVPEARKKFPAGSNVQIDPKKGVVRFTGPYASYSGWDW